MKSGNFYGSKPILTPPLIYSRKRFTIWNSLYKQCGQDQNTRMYVSAICAQIPDKTHCQDIKQCLRVLQYGLWISKIGANDTWKGELSDSMHVRHDGNDFLERVVRTHGPSTWNVMLDHVDTATGVQQWEWREGTMFVYTPEEEMNIALYNAACAALQLCAHLSDKLDAYSDMRNVKSATHLTVFAQGVFHGLHMRRTHCNPVVSSDVCLQGGLTEKDVPFLNPDHLDVMATAACAASCELQCYHKSVMSEAENFTDTAANYRYISDMYNACRNMCEKNDLKSLSVVPGLGPRIMAIKRHVVSASAFLQQISYLEERAPGHGSDIDALGRKCAQALYRAERSLNKTHHPDWIDKMNDIHLHPDPVSYIRPLFEGEISNMRSSYANDTLIEKYSENISDRLLNKNSNDGEHDIYVGNITLEFLIDGEPLFSPGKFYSEASHKLEGLLSKYDQDAPMSWVLSGDSHKEMQQIGKAFSKLFPAGKSPAETPRGDPPCTIYDGLLRLAKCHDYLNKDFGKDINEDIKKLLDVCHENYARLVVIVQLTFFNNDPRKAAHTQLVTTGRTIQKARSDAKYWTKVEENLTDMGARDDREPTSTKTHEILDQSLEIMKATMIEVANGLSVK